MYFDVKRSNSALFLFLTFNPRKMALPQKKLRPRNLLVSGLTAHLSKPMLTKFCLQSQFRLGEMAMSGLVMFCTFAIRFHSPSGGIYRDSGKMTKIWRFYQTEIKCPRWQMFDDFPEDLAPVHGLPPLANVTNIRRRLVRNRTFAIWRSSSIIQQMPKSALHGCEIWGRLTNQELTKWDNHQI